MQLHHALIILRTQYQPKHWPSYRAKPADSRCSKCSAPEPYLWRHTEIDWEISTSAKPLDEKHNHGSGNAKTTEIVSPCHKISPWKATSPKPTEKIFQIRDHEAGHPRNGSHRCEKKQGSISQLQSAECRAVVIGVQLAVWREYGPEESWASKSIRSYLFLKRIRNMVYQAALMTDFVLPV